jgi:chromatin remodeling complex protein RSC6
MPAKQSTKTSTPAAAATTPAATPKAAKAPKTAAAAAPAEVKASAAVAETKAPKTPKAAKAPKAVAAPVASETVVVAAAPVTEDAAVSVSSVSTDFSDFMAKLQQLSTAISSIKTEFRTLEKKASRELKSAAKASQKRKRKDRKGNRSPSGFVKPTLISDELASFLGKDKGTEMARTEVTREINAYIRANQLQDKTNGRRINADTKLSSLLKLASGDELTYFNLQRYMSPHFAKSVPATNVVVASA